MDKCYLQSREIDCHQDKDTANYPISFSKRYIFIHICIKHQLFTTYFDYVVLFTIVESTNSKNKKNQSKASPSLFSQFMANMKEHRDTKSNIVGGTSSVIGGNMGSSVVTNVGRQSIGSLFRKKSFGSSGSNSTSPVVSTSTIINFH